MVDIASISAALHSLKAAMDIAAYLNTTEKKWNSAELKLKIAELTDALLSAKSGILESSNLLSEKQVEIDRLNEALAFKAKLIFINGLYHASGQPLDNPYCPGCWESNHKAIHLHRVPRDCRSLECPVCRNKYPSGRDHRDLRLHREAIEYFKEPCPTLCS